MKNILAIPTDTEVSRYFFQRVMDEFGIKYTALNDRIKAAEITPFREGKKPYLDDSQMLILRQQNRYLSQEGATLKSYRDSVGLEDSKPLEFGKLTIAETTPRDKYETDFPAILDMEIIRRNALDAIGSNERIQAYAQFEIYSRSQETMTSREIEELIGVAPTRTGFKYERYKFILYSTIYVVGKEGLQPQKMKTWLIEKFDPLAERRARNAKNRARRKAKKVEQLALDQGAETYQGIKELMAGD